MTSKSSKTNAPDLGGIMAAIATPFTANGESVNAETIPPFVEHVIAGGVQGLIPCGSTGEFTSMTLDERMGVVERVADAARNRVALIPHVGALRTRDAAELMRHAASMDAAAVMAVPPFYDPLTWPEIIDYHAQISAAAPHIPIMAYHNPSATGERITVEQIDELVEAVPAVRYMKDSSGDAQLVDELLAHTADSGLQVFNGCDALTFQGLVCGAKGSVWGAASFMPRLAADFFAAVHDRQDLGAARLMWQRIRPICRLLETAGYPAAVKAACEIVGLPLGPTRDPLGAITPKAHRELRRLLDEADLVDSAAVMA